MDISSTAEFAADPDRVFTMMTDKGYLEDVCRASDSLSYDVSVNGSSTRTSRTLAAPASAARFTGPELTVVEEVLWGQAGADGSRTGAVKLTILGQPVNMNGQLQLRPGGPGTIAALTGELKVSVPFIGKKLEESSAPAVLASFRTQQKVGNNWLQG
jgi:hypothetical protein